MFTFKMRREYTFRYMEMLIQYTTCKGNITENDHTQPLNKNIWNLFPLLTSNLLLLCKKKTYKRQDNLPSSISVVQNKFIPKLGNYF